VVPLAFVAVAATVGAIALTSEMFRDLSGDRYAAELVHDEFPSLRL
jgi:hypothetical protein